LGRLEADMGFRCDVDFEGGAVVARLTGNLHAHGAKTLWASVSPRLVEDTVSLLVDLSGLELITSAGIGTLVRLLQRTQTQGGRMVVFGAKPRVREIIDVVMLGEILGLCDTVEEARARIEAL
jgi:anti-anti-sigma factor